MRLAQPFIPQPSSLIPFSAGSDRADVLEREADAVARDRTDGRGVDEVAAELEGGAVAGARGADEVSLFEERALPGVEIQLDVGAHSIPPQRAAGVQPDLTRPLGLHAGDGRRIPERGEPGEAQVLVRASAGSDDVCGEAGLVDLVRDVAERRIRIERD